jgi:hypothetical protein
VTVRVIPALSIRQPWAELILRGEKQIEVRTWATNYRGWVWLHTGKERPGDDEIDKHYGKLFRGGYVGRFLLNSILSFDREKWDEWKEQHLDTGDYKSGTFAWLIEAAVRFPNPIPAPGQLNLFYPGEAMLDKLNREYDAVSTILVRNPAESAE